MAASAVDSAAQGGSALLSTAGIVLAIIALWLVLAQLLGQIMASKPLAYAIPAAVVLAAAGGGLLLTGGRPPAAPAPVVPYAGVAAVERAPAAAGPRSEEERLRAAVREAAVENERAAAQSAALARDVRAFREALALAGPPARTGYLDVRAETTIPHAVRITVSPEWRARGLDWRRNEVAGLARQWRSLHQPPPGEVAALFVYASDGRQIASAIEDRLRVEDD